MLEKNDRRYFNPNAVDKKNKEKHIVWVKQFFIMGDNFPDESRPTLAASRMAKMLPLIHGKRV